ncbi:MAG TPA: hypothetical protein VH061_15330 [Solirubrobacteraceae bacterium]|jgi:hypothetical protein|nr:hypothetical protein [Solirubrobacteraceae bacterium]
MEENERQPDHDRQRQGLPGKQEHNREQQEPVEPTRRKPGDGDADADDRTDSKGEDGGDSKPAGASGEGSQSTGNPNSAG